MSDDRTMIVEPEPRLEAAKPELVERAGCCGPVVQASCCAPQAKAACCAPDQGDGCGCR